MRARHRSLLATVGAVAVAAALLSPPGAARAADDPAVVPITEPTGAADATARAVEVLEQADEIVSGEVDGRDASLALLELARTRSALPAARRAEADRILARPTDTPDTDAGGRFGYAANALPTQACQGGFCVHWARATSDAPDLTDADANGRPDYVDRVFATLLKVSGTYVAAGYRKPVSDRTRGGGTNQFDVYLVDTGREGLYGYCVPEGVTSSTQRSAQAYCSLDNDFASKQFPANTPVHNLQVTTAHEYFHAVQFAYDITDDLWFLESTATWAEDEVYDAVNDNIQYLRNSPMSQPRTPIDKGQDLRVYGSWIFFRYLSELEPGSRGGMPTIVRDILTKAAGPAYSLQAVRAVLKERGRSMTATVARFSAANRHPARSYREGARYPVTRPEGTARVARNQLRRASLKLNHLSSGTVRYRPGKRTNRASTRLRIAVDLPRRTRPTAAVVTVRRESGKISSRLVRLRPSGAGLLSVPFVDGRIAYVDVTLVNAGTRYACGRGTVYSCQGRSLDDGLRLRVRVRAVTR
ncbi:MULTISPECIES: MXAN_6640 family putative metalloprotease [unclassified Nocardioides]|uniref:MXAN_6640 family putative metalloprotease n=1 Tax=unclassified Nocardioides TaxID=2615069 RepID=UPI00301433F7